MRDNYGIVMKGASRRGWHVAVTAGLLACCPCAFALNPALDVSQYAHTAWRYRDGFTKGEIHDIVQTSDGYLWLATEFGLVRFDGVRIVPWQPPPDQRLPSSDITELLPARDGTLWIGTRNGLASWKNNQLKQYPDLAGIQIHALLEDHEGAIWGGGYGIPSGRLCEIRKDVVRCHGEIGGLSRGVTGLHEDAAGNLWVGLVTGVWRWKPGPPEFYAMPLQLNGIRGMANGENGALLISAMDGVIRLADGKAQIAYPFPLGLRGFGSSKMLRDREGGLWIATAAKGLVHIHQGRTEVFSQSDGLTADRVVKFFEDREGNIWVSTGNGLDRFRELPVVTYSLQQGLSAPPSGAVLGVRDGSIWFGTADGLNRLSRGQFLLYRPRNEQPRTGFHEIAGSGLPDRTVGSLFQDSRGRIWVSTLKGVGYLENDRYVSTTIPSRGVSAITEDTAGNLWIAGQDEVLFRWSPDNEVQQIPYVTLGHKDPAMRLAADPAQGGLWLGFFQGGLIYFRDSEVRASYSSADGLGRGRVNSLRFDREGALWAATEGGLSRLKNGRIATLTSKNGLPCDAVQWAAEDGAGSAWLNMPCGLVRIARSELDAWAAAGDSRRTIQTKVFDISDGVVSSSVEGGYSPHVTRSPDGRLWFWNGDGLGVVDPRHLPFNKLPPPVHIETVKTNGKEVASDEGMELSHRNNDLEIDYTALSLTLPERVRFRYKLEGKDMDWRDAGTSRQAYYGGLAPRKYRFRVKASNNDGVWNEAGAAWNFSITPAYYQTTWFQGLCALAAAGLTWLLYRLRLRQVAQRYNLRMEERINERTRIARDLHDTLLQSFQGVLLKFHAVTYRLPDRPEARKELEGAIEEARKAITEGRDAVQGLRSSVVVTNDLARAITTFGEGLASDQNGRQAPDFRVHVEGASRDLPPLVRDEIYRIAGEALRNAFRHAGARRIEVEIHYETRHLRMRIRDDGKGIDPQVLSAGGSGGHHGLPGMRERAELVGGKLAVWSEVASGTEIELVIPSAIAYAKAQAASAGGQGNLIKG